MNLDDIKKELIQNGKNPADFNIRLYENKIEVTPKWSYQPRQIAKEEDIALGIELTDRELENIQLGQQMTDLELRIIELEMGVI